MQKAKPAGSAAEERPSLAKTEATAEELFSRLAAEADEEETAGDGHTARRGG